MMKPSLKITRRQFLQILAIGGTASCVAGLTSKWLSVKTVLSESRLLMGTIINLTVIAEDYDQGQSAIAATLDHMANMESIFSRFIPESQLSLLNLNGYLAAPDAHFVRLIQQANLVSANTGGLFDISIKPLMDLYEAVKRAGTSVPDATEIQQEISKIGHKNITISDQEIRFTKPGMSVSLDGIAKGYIVDQGVAILNQAGFGNVIVEAGGDLFASGEREQSGPWQIGIQSPRQENPDLLQKISLSNCALATSGDYQQFYSPDMANHHILNPLTGYSSTFLSSASVLAPSCMLADAYATVLMVMDPMLGMELIEGMPGVEAFLVTKQMETIRSTNFSKF
ncbi:FAD:protein FMN transferase [bacterium]|nr:FAD:protein FMN transferase [bacterium]